ncbi:DUF2087 domain-containing protein [Candidatus Woesearchaeota archaeon]|nr:DUF2087 domain-containing protein [Candidatus Woesearchaeota archaeon]
MTRIDFELDEKKFFEKCAKNKNFPRNDALKQVILKKITAEFEKNKKYGEQEVNNKIKKYFDDYVLIRRELINFGYMQRDPAKAEYWVVKYELSKEDFLRIDRLKRHAKEIGIIE